MTTRDPRTDPQAGDTIRVTADHDVDVVVGTVLRVVVGPLSAPFREGYMRVRYWTNGDYPEGESTDCEWWPPAEWLKHAVGAEVLS